MAPSGGAMHNQTTGKITSRCTVHLLKKGRKKASKGLTRTLLNMEIEFQLAIQLTIAIIWP